MKPTQAQIAAARIVLRASTCFGNDICRSVPCACAEAAASAVTAAAEVGESRDARITKREYDDALDDIRQTTIERCAQVADSFILRDKDGNAQRTLVNAADVSAAIRALKDKP